MTTEGIDPNLEWLLQSDWRGTLIPSVGQDLWVTVYSHESNEDLIYNIFSALIPITYVQTSLSNNSWDLHVQSGHPGCITSCDGDEEVVKYLRFGNSEGIEPFIIRRNFLSVRDSYNEILEEFRHFHNLYHNEKDQFLKFDESGNETIVAKIEANKVEVRLKEIRQFLAIKEMHLAIYFDSKRFSELLPNNFPIKIEHKDDLTFYTLFASAKSFNGEGKHCKSFSRLLGKKLIPPFSLNCCGIWPFEESEKEEYIDFIVGLDENGNSVKYSCNPDGLANNFGKNPDVPNYLTPIFFRREVLTKYYAHSERYTVEDGYLRCQGIWGLQLDNNHNNYIIVFLGDLGRDLPSDEQMYWRSQNIPPEGKISKVNFQRSFLAKPTDPEQIDLVFKSNFAKFSKNWKIFRGWSLFLPLAESDSYLFEALHIPLTNSQAEFDSQILAVTKIIIDSLNEQEIVKATSGGNPETKGGISKFEKFLETHQYPNCQQNIQFLRNLQDLRSSGVAHRKGDTYKKNIKKIGLTESNRADVLKNILVEATGFLLSLENHFLQSSGEKKTT